jgi:hypothetical protein
MIVKVVVHVRVDILRGHGRSGRDGRHMKSEVGADEAVDQMVPEAVEGAGHGGLFIGGQGWPGDRKARQQGKDVSEHHQPDGEPRPPRRLVPANHLQGRVHFPFPCSPPCSSCALFAVNLLGVCSEDIG